MRVLSLWIVVYLFQRRIEEEIWLCDFLDFSVEKAYYRGELFNSYKKELVVSFISICISSSRCSAIFSLFLDGSIQHRERVCFSWFSYYFLSFAGFFFIFSEVALLEERSPKLEKRYLFWRRANYSRVSFERYNIFLRSRPSIHGRIARLARICAPEIILHIRG